MSVFRRLRPLFLIAILSILTFYQLGNELRKYQSERDLLRFSENLLSTFHQYEPVPKNITLRQTAMSSRLHHPEALQEIFTLPTNDLHRMQEMHASVLNELPEYPAQLFHGRGIVMVAGGKYLRVALHSIRMLRRTGTQLPIELWMGDWSEHDANFCKEVLGMNVQCRILADYLGDGWVGGYQLKPFAILLSSFEEILLLDSDNFPIAPIDDIFSSSQYLTNGVVVWPDFWASTTSPYMYQIIDRPEKFVKTCETGQLLWNKRTHFRALSLACYYNFHGPSYFYPLLSLGVKGQGDKETYLVACEATDQSYAFITADVQSLGYCDDSGFHRTGMAQADPRNISHTLFFHANAPKLDAMSLFIYGVMRAGGQGVASLWGIDGKAIAGFDVEAVAFQELAYVECDSSIALRYSGLCEQVHRHIDRREKHLMFIGNGTRY